jgi:uncharacterized protein (TIGR02453 family)
MLQKSTLDFLKKLKKNNNKPWMDENREIYLHAKADFESFGQILINQIIAFDPAIDGIKVKDCTFRINRDVRFSKNKEPYKPNMGINIKLHGKKSKFAGYYLHVEPGSCFVAAGCYGPEPDALKKIRQEIDYNIAQFEKIIKQSGFKKTFPNGLLKDGALVNVPKGYDKDSIAAEYLKLKHYIVSAPIIDELVLTAKGVNQIAKQMQSTKPFIDFINSGLAD